MKKAFTMLELVFAIVVIGILAAAIIPNTRTNPVQEAAIQLTSAVRYTQHLALVDDKYNAANATWFRNRWQIRFSGTNDNNYTIVSDNNTTFAVDPQNSAKNLQKELKGVSVTLGGDCENQSIISFDYMGRPFKGSLATAATPYANVIVDTCTLVISNGVENATLTIMPETGYVQTTY
jgi:prepilin-type N-terminal cleavage/methylation domain-containing protein